LTAARIAKALAGHRSGHGYLCRCPVPLHGKGNADRNPSLSIADGAKGLLVRCFAGCDARDILAELRRRGLLDDCAETSRREEVRAALRPAPEPDPEPDKRALELWRSAMPVQGTPAEQYFRSRGITIGIPESIRFIQHLDYVPRISFPGLIAAVQRPDRQIIACQVTWLDPGGKAKVSTPRKTIGRLGSGAVRLGPAGDALGVAEGVESALSAMQVFGVQAWASLGAHRIHKIVIPNGVRDLLVFAKMMAPAAKQPNAPFGRTRTAPSESITRQPDRKTGTMPLRRDWRPRHEWNSQHCGRPH